MLKKTIYVIGLASLISMMLVGCGKSKASHQSNKPYGAGQTSKKVRSESTSSTSTNSDSSSNNSNSSISASSLNLDDKTYGILAWEYKNDLNAKTFGKKGNTDQYSYYTSVKKPNPKDAGFLADIFYADKSNSAEDANNHQYNELTNNGDGTIDLHFKVDKSTVTIEYKDTAHAGNKGVSEMPAAVKTVSKDYLVNTYYKTASQRQHVDNCVKSTLSEDEWQKAYDNQDESSTRYMTDD